VTAAAPASMTADQATKTIRFAWHAPMSHEDATIMGIAAEQRAHQRWRIHDLEYRIIERKDIAILEINWTYGPVHGGRPDDGRKFIERVLNDAFDRSLMADMRDEYPDVVVLEESDGVPITFVQPLGGG